MMATPVSLPSNPSGLSMGEVNGRTSMRNVSMHVLNRRTASASPIASIRIVASNHVTVGTRRCWVREMILA